MKGKCAPVITLHYAEIALKGKNRGSFEKALLENIRRKLEGTGYRAIERKASRVIIRLDDAESAQSIMDKLKYVFGIKWFSFGYAIGKDLESLEKTIVGIAETCRGKKIRIKTKRADKKFPMTSPEVGRHLGRMLERMGFSTDTKDADVELNVEILDDEIIVSSNREEGQGGLPVGSSGRLLCLFSGGIDSPVAVWLMMKRGAVVDLLHVHGMADNAAVKNSKIANICEKLAEYSGKEMRLYLAPYDEFYAKSALLPAREEAVLFRRFLIRLANRIAEKFNYIGIITGDSLGQVASQTVENIAAVDEVAEKPVYRPLIAMDKEEIVALAQKIGTYLPSIEKYKDCCSLVAHSSPATRAKKERQEDAEKRMAIDEVIEKTLGKTEILRFPSRIG